MAYIYICIYNAHNMHPSVAGYCYEQFLFTSLLGLRLGNVSFMSHNFPLKSHFLLQAPAHSQALLFFSSRKEEKTSCPSFFWAGRIVQMHPDTLTVSCWLLPVSLRLNGTE